MKYPLTLRGRITLLAASVTSLALIVLAAGTWVYVYWESLDAIDEHLLIEVLEIRSDLAADLLKEHEFKHNGFGAREGLAVFAADGRTIGVTPTFPNHFVNKARADLGFRIHSNNDSRWRIYSTEVHGVIVVAGFDLEEFDDVLNDLATIQFLLVPFVALLTAWISWHVAGRSLAPLREATETAARIGASDLSDRLPKTQSDDEIAQFTRVLNSMLDRIEYSYLQSRRFAGDASHELSTPLTIIKGELEGLLAKNILSMQAEHGLVSVQHEVDRMHQIIDQLLLLARFDAGKVSTVHVPINLSSLLQELTEDIDLLSEKLVLSVTHEIAPEVWIRGDAGQLRRLFLNLFSNATKYNIAEGSVGFHLRRHNRVAEFLIRNSGALISAPDQERVFERFYQADKSHATVGNGLGLSLCREIAHAHGGTIALVSSTLEATIFRLELPIKSVG